MNKIATYFCNVRCPFSRVEGHDAVFFKGHRGDFFQVFFLAFHAFKEHHCRGHRRTTRRPFRRSREEDQGRRQPAGLPKLKKDKKML